MFLYIDVSDCGPDQAARKRKLHEYLSQSHVPNNVIYMDSICFLHQYHRAVSDALTLTDSMITSFFDPEMLDGFKSYFGSLASVCSTWRLLARDMMSVWDKQHVGSDIETQRLGRRYPLQCLQGRWGSIEAAERFLTQRLKKDVSEAMLAVLSKHMRDLNAL